MRLTCPLCGPRDLREFTVIGGGAGATTAADRPSGEAWSEIWHAHLHLRPNPAGRSRELWYHGAGCASWLIVERDTVNHEIHSVRRASEASA